MFKRFFASFHTRTGAFLFYALAAAAFLFLHSATFAHGWIAELYPLGSAFVPTVLWVIAIFAMALLAFFLAAEKAREIKALRVTHAVICLLSGALFFYTALILFNIDSFSWFGFARGFSHLAPNLIYLGAALILPFFFVIFPRLKKTVQAVLAVLTCLTVALAFIVPYIPALQPDFAFSTNPLVLDIGGDDYSIVFATNRNSTAYVRYTFQGEEFTVASAVDGRLRIGRIHNVTIPREHLNGNRYHIIAREVFSSHDSGTQFGATMHSDEFHFRGEFIDEPNILLAADIHNQGDRFLAAAANMPDPDLFIMLGDISSGVVNNCPAFLIYDIIGFGANATQSVIPAIFVRGNHEMYGEYTEIIRPGLGMPSFYFQTRRGNLLFSIVCSADFSGERLDFREFVRGTANTENNLFREEQLAWMESLAPCDETLHIALVHRPDFGNAAQRDLYYAQMLRLGADIQFSGEIHRLTLEMPGEDGRFGAPFPMLTAGGPTEGYGGLMIGAMAQVRANGTVHLLAYDSAGEQRMNQTIALR